MQRLRRLRRNELNVLLGTASFAAGTLLLGAGILTVRSARGARELPLAAIPLLFSIQQLVEGVVWMTFRYEAPLLNAAMTHAYSFFSHVLWPVYVPVAVLLIEPPGWRRATLWGLSVAGAAVAAYLMYTLMVFPVVSRAIGQHIEYVSPHFFAAAVMSVYLLSTAISPMVSTHRWVTIFGVLAAASFAAAYYFYARWFISVWCLFAAVLSLVLCAHLTSKTRRTEASAATS